ncbi:helix-turn-helix domain-containing protein [Candidatus Sulfidibacterium hydrothermale]|uniref:helix-turn-helix domain-containing protein n=1 Tax=Candidatus Sulfidibacterium hydrothermale TaxID=2875962 RepID=UPI001F0AAE5A|nr:helix-turn-helix transcriptional regulator [Candidatus Sulfidibacterium hydrothermale]UBM61581.1 helix-turn-helix domain-containing protein [Candidatus Sulfidibacterium hydrothermale]
MQVLQDMIHFTPFYVTFFWGIVFLLNPYHKNRARYGLGIFMLAAAAVYLTHAVFFTHNYSFYLKIDGLYMFADLLVYPLYYFYIRLLTKDLKFRKCYIWHILPALLLAVAFEWASIKTSAEGHKIYLHSVLLNHTFPAKITEPSLRWMVRLYFASRVVFGIQSLVYLILSIRLIRKYHRRIANFYSNLQGHKLAWLELLTITLIVAAISSFLLNILGRHFFEQKNLVLIPSLIFSTLLFIIGFLGNKQNQTIAHVIQDENRDDQLFEKPVSSILLKEKLQELMENERPYLNPQLRITDLSNRLFTNRTYLSKLINSEFKMSFNDFVNRYRVEYAKDLLAQDKEAHYSLNYFSEQAGFGSLSSFLRAFKQQEGETAGMYRRKLIKKTD